MSRPDGVTFRLHVRAFAHLRKLLPVAVLAGALVGPVLVAEPIVAMWISLPLVFCTLVALRSVSELPRYPAHTFGIEYRAEEVSFAGESSQCVRCERIVETGVHRRYARQVVLLGVPVYTLGWGSNEFCESCVETRYDPDTAPATANADSASETGTATRTASPGAGTPEAAQRTNRPGPGPESIDERRVAGDPEREGAPAPCGTATSGNSTSSATSRFLSKTLLEITPQVSTSVSRTTSPSRLRLARQNSTQETL